MRLFTTLVLSFWTVCAFAQLVNDPVTWSFTLGEDEGVHVVLAQAEIEKGWYIYSQFLADGGPIPTAIDLSNTPGIELRGEPTEEGKAISGFEKMFGMEVTKYTNQVNFMQAFELAEGSSVVEGTLRFMACTSTKCLPPKTLDISLAVSEK